SPFPRAMPRPGLAIAIRQRTKLQTPVRPMRNMVGRESVRIVRSSCRSTADLATEYLEHPAVEGRNVVRLATGDEFAIHDACLIDPLRQPVRGRRGHTCFQPGS